MKHSRILLLGLFLLFVNLSNAQKPVASGGLDLKERLDLNKKQEQKIRAINKDIAERLRKAMSKYGDDQNKRIEAIREINKARNKRYKKVLSEDQWQKCCEIRKEETSTKNQSND